MGLGASGDDLICDAVVYLQHAVNHYSCALESRPLDIVTTRAKEKLKSNPCVSTFAIFPNLFRC